MMWVSFAWTVGALLRGEKCVTRRCWPDDYAAKFVPGLIFGALDKDRRWGGKPAGICRVVSIRREALAKMENDPVYAIEELAREGDRDGNLWPTIDAFVAPFRAKHRDDPWRLEFKWLGERIPETFTQGELFGG
jgi:hypothetical protein